MTGALEVTVILVTHRSRPHVAECLRALPAALQGLAYEVVAIDNASDDGTMDILRREFPEVRGSRNETNRGFAAAVNEGAHQAAGRAFLLLNPDTVPAPGSLALLWRVLEASPTVGLAGPQLVNPDGSLQPSAWRAPGLLTAVVEALLVADIVPRAPWSVAGVSHEADVPCLSGASLLVRRECFEALGGLDGRFFLYHEDFDLCLRARRAGWGVRFVPAARVVHLVGGSAFQDRRSFAERFHQSRRQLFLKHGQGAAARAHLGGLLLRRALYRAAGTLFPRWRARSDDVSSVLRVLRSSPR